jgi:hypothetical protein
VIRFCPLLLLAVACAPDDPKPIHLPDASTTPTTPSTPEPADPALSFTMAPKEVAAGDLVSLEVVVEDFVLVDPTRVPPPKPRPGKGHFHVWIDGELAGAAWVEAVDLDTTGLEPGDHEVTLTLEDSVHQELDPPVEASDTLTITEP